MILNVITAAALNKQVLQVFLHIMLLIHDSVVVAVCSRFDVIQNRIVTGMLEEHGKFNSTAAIAHAEGHINRRINLTCRREGEYLGFNIRGGREYALGIYVSG